MRGHKRERRPGVWELIVNDGRDPVSGRRRQVSRTFHGGVQAAETALAGLVAEVAAQRHGPGTDAPLTALVLAWLELVADDLSPTTVAGYRAVLRTHIAPTIGKRPVSEITTADLDGFYRGLLDGRRPATVRQVHAVIRRSFQQAVKWGWLTSNPAREATPPRVRKAVLSVPEPGQVAALVAAAKGDFGVLLRTAAATGMRRGELVGLRWSRVRAASGTVVVDETVVEVGGELIEKGTKTHQARVIAVDGATLAALEGLRDRQERLAEAIGAVRVADPFVFLPDDDPSGAVPLRPDVVSKRFRRLAVKHAPGCRLHDLRHFTATQLLAAGVPVKSVSARLGHASATMTLDVYAHAVPAADRASADVLGGLLEPGVQSGSDG